MSNHDPADQMRHVEELVEEGSDMSQAMLVTGIGGDTSAGRRVFLRWLERHGRLDLRAHFEVELPSHRDTMRGMTT